MGFEMSKQYVFWRKPDGRPCTSNDGRHAPTYLLSRYGELSSVNSAKGISWPSTTELHRIELAIRSSVVIIEPDGRELNQTTSWSLVKNALNSVILRSGGSKPLLQNEIVSEASKVAAAFFRRPLSDYYLLSSLSIDRFPARSIRVDDCVVTKGPQTKQRQIPDSLKGTIRFHGWISEAIDSPLYTLIKVATRARDVHEALDKSTDALNLLRGYWTLFATYGSWVLSFNSNPKPRPIGAIRSGLIHTLHNPDGSPATDVYWYEPAYAEVEKSFDPKGNWKSIEDNRRLAMRRMKNCDYRRDLEALICRYVVAMDSPDLDSTLLQLWSILEKVTNTVGASYDETIDRATWFFRDRQFHKQVLSSLRLRRNQLVHAAKSGPENDQAVYAIKFIIEPHLMCLIQNEFKVRSLSEYADYLSLPSTVSVLEKRRLMFSRALRLMKSSF
jgi:hypothetical protein